LKETNESVLSVRHLYALNSLSECQNVIYKAYKDSLELIVFCVSVLQFTCLKLAYVSQKPEHSYRYDLNQ